MAGLLSGRSQLLAMQAGSAFLAGCGVGAWLLLLMGTLAAHHANYARGIVARAPATPRASCSCKPCWGTP